jgi:hypothetical protein
MHLTWANSGGAGWGKQRPRLRTAAKPKMGKEGEDIVASGTADGDLSLRMPARYHPASVKGAAWQVAKPFEYCIPLYRYKEE